MLAELSAIFVDQFGAFHPGYRLHRLPMQIDATVMFMLPRVKVHPGFLLGDGFGPPPLHFAAEEAWMSIEAVHVTAAGLRFE